MNQVGARWWNSYEGKPRTNAVRAGVIKYLAQCDLKEKGCRRRAVLQIECLEHVGIAFWRKDLCETHAKQILAKAEPLGITIFRD
ncbi:MAG: hypothetical protein ACLQAT_32100 [Candidatus Binataceae bacterium]